MVSEDPSLGPQVASTGVGVILMAGNLGGALVVMTMGALKDLQGDFSGAVEFASALAVVALAVAVTVRDPHFVPLPEPVATQRHAG
jgi:nitrate/nitrite transporter NarK